MAVSMLHTLNWGLTDDQNPYIAEGANWDSVGYIYWEENGSAFTGTGTLVRSAVDGEYKFLTAAHNPNSDHDNVIPASEFFVYFGDDAGEDGQDAVASVTVSSSNVALNPLWASTNGSSQYDLAVFSFSPEAVTGVLPSAMSLSTANPIGQMGTTVGYGTWGNGQNFAGFGADGIRRAGTNMIDVVGDPDDNPTNTGFTIQTDFDGPNGEGHTIGSSVGLPLEATTASGDSGGPLLVDGEIVGVLNGGFPGLDGNASEYGDRSIWAPIMDPDNQAFLIAQGIVIPEVSSAFLLAVCACGGLVRRRRL